MGEEKAGWFGKMATNRFWADPKAVDPALENFKKGINRLYIDDQFSFLRKRASALNDFA